MFGCSDWKTDCLLVRGYTVLEIGLANDFATTTMVIHYLLYITFEVVLLSISTLLAAISVLLSSFEDISSILFELASDFYGVPPRASFPTEKCAILILGAQEGASLTPSAAITYPRIPPPSQVWEETRRCHSPSWAIPSLRYVQIEEKGLDTFHRLRDRETLLR